MGLTLPLCPEDLSALAVPVGEALRVLQVISQPCLSPPT